jgi:hypothetical protein
LKEQDGSEFSDVYLRISLAKKSNTKTRRKKKAKQQNQDTNKVG